MASPLWIELYHLAILETDGAKMPQRIAGARYALEQGQKSLLSNGRPQKVELEKALNSLKILERESRAWPAAKRA